MSEGESASRTFQSRYSRRLSASVQRYSGQHDGRAKVSGSKLGSGHSSAYWLRHRDDARGNGLLTRTGTAPIRRDNLSSLLVAERFGLAVW